MARRPPREDAASDPHRDPERGADPRWSERRDGGSAHGFQGDRRAPSGPRGPRTEPYATPNGASDATRELARQRPVDPREAPPTRPDNTATNAQGIPPVGRIRQPRTRRPDRDATNGYGYGRSPADRPTTDFSMPPGDHPTVDGLPRVPGPPDAPTATRPPGHLSSTGEQANGYPPPRPPNFSGPDYGMPPPSGIPYGAPYGAPPGQPAPGGRTRESPYRQPYPPPSREYGPNGDRESGQQQPAQSPSGPPPSSGQPPGHGQPIGNGQPGHYGQPAGYGRPSTPGEPGYHGQPPGHGRSSGPGRPGDQGQPRRTQPPGPGPSGYSQPAPGRSSHGHPGHGQSERGRSHQTFGPGQYAPGPPPYGRPDAPTEQQSRIPHDYAPNRGAPDDGVTAHETGRWSSSRGMWVPAEPREEPPGFAIERFEETSDLRRTSDRGRNQVIDAADWTERLDQRPEWHPHNWDDAPTGRSTDWSESPLPPPPPNRRVMDVEPERDPVASDLMGERVPAGTVSAALAPLVWFALAIAAYLVAVFVFNDGAERAEALDAGIRALPWLGVAATMSVGMALAFRWIGAGWKAAGLGFAAAVVSGTLTTVLNSLIFG